MSLFPPRHSLIRAGRLQAAAREIAGARPISTVDRSLRGLAACSCQSLGRSGLKGYNKAVLRGTVRYVGRGLGATPTQGTPALVPVSDRSAVSAAVKALQSGQLRVR